MEFQPQIGDVILRRNLTLPGLIAYSIFPSTKLHWPSGKYPNQLAIHSSIFAYKNFEAGVFESSYFKIFFFTSWKDYLKLAESGQFEMKVCRMKNLGDENKNRLNEYLNKKLNNKIKYDYLGPIALMLDAILRKTIFRFHSKPRWFCYEVVKYSYGHVHKDFFGLNFPTPEYLEEIVNSGILEVVADIYKDENGLRCLEYLK